MTLSFCSFSSGSSGNSYLIKTEETAILVDVGISGKRIFGGLESTNTPLEMVKGVLITHEHIDHIKSLRIVCKKAVNSNAYANTGTWRHIEDLVQEEKKKCFITGKSFAIGDIEINSFPVSHDAEEPVGYSFFHENKKISVVTDTGYLSEDIMSEVSDADILVLESNHEEGLVQYCSYPYNTKRRIMGDKGHLSNVAAGEGLCNIIEKNKKKRWVLLAHLSRENNTPQMAKQAIKNILEEKQYYIGKDLDLSVIVKDCLSPIYQI